MRNIIFNVERIVDDPEEMDTWVIYQPNILGGRVAYSLEQLLWQIEFDQS